MASYTGSSGKKTYTLGTQLAAGGEGVVYEISGDNAHVAKLYKADRFSSEAERATMERKLKAMISMNIPAIVDGILRLAWPQDILYENGRFVGFVMPRLNTKYKIYDLYRTGKNSVREREYKGKYTWKYSVQIAYNMAWVVSYVHRHNIVIGDLNQNNISVDALTGAVILIDCDSFDIYDPVTKEHFPCVVGLPEMLAPELQTVGSLRNATFTKESDNFSLAIHIFRLLMNNEDPFGGAMTTNASQSNIPANAPIVNGECLYVRNVPGKKWLPRMPKLDILPASLQQLFRKTFNYTATTALSKRKDRATADEWVNALIVLGAPEPNHTLSTCPVNPRHVYPHHNTSCPWCAIEKAVAPTPLPTPSSRTSVTPKASSGSAGRSTAQKSAAQSNSASRHRPVRRTATLFYIVLILFGLASGVVFGELVSGLLADEMDFQMSVEATGVTLSVLGVIAGAWMAHHFEDKYTRANNALPWLLLGALSLVLPLVVAVVLGLAISILIAALSFVASIVGGLLVLYCVCSACCGS